jgi:hypothetical protein
MTTRSNRSIVQAAMLGSLLAMLLVSVAAGCGSSGAKAAAPRALRFLSIDTSFTPIGFGQRAPKVGDRFLFTTSIYNATEQTRTPSGKQVGRGESLCTVTAPRGLRLFCTGLLYLPGGHIVLSDGVRGNATVNTTAIVGGVGAYANAHGTAQFKVLRRRASGVETNAVILRLMP